MKGWCDWVDGGSTVGNGLMLKICLTGISNGAMGMRRFMHAHDIALPFPVQACADGRDVMLEDDHGSKLWGARALSVLYVVMVILYLGGAGGQLLRLRCGGRRAKVFGNGIRVIVDAA